MWKNILKADPKKGTGKKPKGSARRLYTDENPKDTVPVKFKKDKMFKKHLAVVHLNLSLIKDNHK